MLVKYTFGLLLLFACNAIFAQALNSVQYERIRETANKKEKAVTSLRNAQLIYASEYLLFKSPDGTDTVFLSSIDKVSKYFPYRKTFKIASCGKAEFILLYFYNRKGAKEFKKFMLENINSDKNYYTGKIVAEFLGVAGEILLELMLSGAILF